MMENEPRPDKIEVFLNKALADLEARPSDAVWQRLSTHLPIAQPTGLATLGQRVQVNPLVWALAACSVLFIGQLAYFSARMNRMEQKIEEQTRVIAQFVATQHTQNNSQPNLNSYSSKSILEAPAPAAPFQSKKFASHSTSPVRFDEINESKTAQHATVVGPSDLSTATLFAASNPDPTVQEENNPQRPIELTFIPVMPLVNPLIVAPHENTLPKLARVNLTQPQAQRRPTGITVGFRAFNAASYTRTEALAPAYGAPSSGGERFFANEGIHEGKLFSAGFAFQKSLSSRWLVNSGLEYTQSTSEQKFEPRLKFKDRDKDHTGGGHHGGPGGSGGGHGGAGGHHYANHEHDFNYYLGSSTGSLIFDIQMRQRDSMQQIGEEEEVPFRLTTQQRVKMVTLPLGVQRQWEVNRWQFFAGGGLLLHLMARHTQHVQSFSCDNQNFEMLNEPSLRSVKSNRLTLSTDGYLTAGIGYRMGRTSFQIAPMVARPLDGRFDDFNVNVQSLSIGLSTGILYKL